MDPVAAARKEQHQFRESCRKLCKRGKVCRDSHGVYKTLDPHFHDMITVFKVASEDWERAELNKEVKNVRARRAGLPPEFVDRDFRRVWAWDCTAEDSFMKRTREIMEQAWDGFMMLMPKACFL